MLRVIDRWGDHDIELSPTFMGAHGIPPSTRPPARVRRADRRGYAGGVAASGLAEWCDVFCETGVFAPDEARESSSRKRAGLKPRIHAESSERSAAHKSGRPSRPLGDHLSSR